MWHHSNATTRTLEARGKKSRRKQNNPQKRPLVSFAKTCSSDHEMACLQKQQIHWVCTRELTHMLTLFCLPPDSSLMLDKIITITTILAAKKMRTKKASKKICQIRHVSGEFVAKYTKKSTEVGVNKQK